MFGTLHAANLTDAVRRPADPGSPRSN